jgi:hypothetical protein
LITKNTTIFTKNPTVSILVIKGEPEKPTG